jgi:small subunit ribosomal protein S17
MSERSRRKTVVGVVVSDKMKKTITVQESRLVEHPKYKKYVKKYTKYKAHDEKGEAKVGDTVELVECRRLSKTKFYRLAKVLRRGKGDVDEVAILEPAEITEAIRAKSAPPASGAPAEAGAEPAGQVMP